MKYKIVRSAEFKKLSKDDKSKTLNILETIANGKTLERKYEDHKLQGSFNGLRECHVKPNLLLIYKYLDFKSYKYRLAYKFILIIFKSKYL